MKITQKRKFNFFYLILILLCLFALIALSLLLNNYPKSASHRYHFLHFGTTIQITVSGSDPQLSKNTITEIDNLLADLHYKWHPWRPGKLQTLNIQLARMRPFKADQDILEIINKSKYYYQLSQGYFNPAIGKLVKIWGFHNDNPEENYLYNNSHEDEEKNKRKLRQILKKIPNPNNIIVKNNSIFNTNQFLQLDLSGFIKADAMLQIKKILLVNNIKNALINIGGDIFIMGKKDTNQNWVIASNIANNFIKINLFDNETIASSGTTARKYQDSNKITRHHIINPKTGEPARGFTSVTVINNDPYLADAAATAILIAGLENYKEIIKSMKIDKYILLENGSIFISEKIKDRINS